MHSPFEENKRAPSRPIPSLGSNKGSAAQKSKRTESDYMPVSRNTAPTEPAPESNEAENGSVRIDNAAWINSEDIVLNEDDGAEIETSISVVEESKYKRVFVQPYSKFGDSPARTAGKKVEVFLNGTEGSGKLRLAINEDLPGGYEETEEKAEYWFTAEHWDASELYTSEKVFLPNSGLVHYLSVPGACFHLGSAIPVLESQGYLKAALSGLSDFSSKNSELQLTLLGHTDISGELSLNFEIGLERAQAVYAILENDETLWKALVKKRSGVKDYQQILTNLTLQEGWDCDPGTPDGKDGPKTQEGVKDFQVQANEKLGLNLAVDGKMGPNTWVGILLAIRSITISSAEALGLNYRSSDTEKGCFSCGESFTLDQVKEKREKPAQFENDENFEAEDRRVDIVFSKASSKLQKGTDVTLTAKQCGYYSKSKKWSSISSESSNSLEDFVFSL